MRYNKFTTARLFIASLLGIFFMGSLIGCTREDNHIVEPEQFNNPAVSLSVSGSSALTKGGSASELSFPTSELIGEDKSGNPLYLNTKREIWSVDDIDAATKVTPSTTNSHPLQTTGLGVVLYKQNNDSDLPGTWTLLNNTAVALKATYSAPTWIPSPTINWPNEGKKVHFFVYGPYSDALNSKVTFTATGATQEPRIVDFEVNTNYADQIDLLVANNITSDRTPQTLGLPMGAHNLVLSHALSAIRFKVVSGTPKVESIKVKNVYDKATYNMNTGEWTNQTTTGKEYVINTPTTHTESSDPGYLYFDDVYTLMMIPSQSGGSSPLPNTASIEIKLEGAEPLVVNISSHTWLAGYYQTYIIDKNAVEAGFTYVMDAVNPTMTYQGGTSTNGKVISYRYPVGTDDSDVSARVAVSWTVEGYYPDATSAANKDYNQRLRRGLVGTFVNSFTPTVGSGSTSGESLTLSYQAAVVSNVTTNRPGDAYDAAIAAAPKVGTTTPYNLAGYIVNTDGTITNPNADNTTIMNTANTYIINGAGYYRFPIVMGNGVKNGTLNETAYTQDGFVDFRGNAISSPYLNGTGNDEPTRAILSWRSDNGGFTIDVNNPQGSAYGSYAWNYDDWCLKNEGSPSTQTITNGISKIDDVYWVNFHIPSATKQGIANIVVFSKDGKVMWSWLIWLTDWKIGTGDIAFQTLVDQIDESAGRLSIKMMPRVLGLVDCSENVQTKYESATPLYVRLEQSESGLHKVVALERNETTINEWYDAFAPTYQWGRFSASWGGKKDPMNDAKEGGYVGFFPSHNGNGYIGRKVSLAESINTSYGFISQSTGGIYSDAVSEATIKKLWNTNETQFRGTTVSTDIKVGKSIYDPCPVGYTVPRLNAFMPFLIGIGELDNWGWRNGAKNIESNTSNAATYYTYWRNSKSDPNYGYTITLPFVSSRGSTGAIEQWQHNHFWTAGLYIRSYARHFRSDSWTWCRPAFGDNMALGRNILPQREES